MRRVLAGGLIVFLVGILLGYFFYQKYNTKARLARDEFFKGVVNNDVREKNSELKKHNDLQVDSFVTTHHLLADKLISNIFSEVAQRNKKQKIDRIVLISPNHFNIGNAGITISDENFSLENNKVIYSDQKAVNKISNLDFVYKDRDAFFKEHGIRGLLPFVNKYFSDIPIVTIMVKDGVRTERMEQLAQTVDQLNGNTLVILSADFSHYLSRTVSNWHDQKAVDVIANFDYPAVYNSEIDCNPGLYFLMKFSELQNYKKFVWMDNSNSSAIYKEDLINKNTSYITGYFAERMDSKTSNINKSRLSSILFLGDLMLDRHNRMLAEEHGVGYFTEKVERLFWGQDLNVVNLEGLITKEKSVSVGKPVEDLNHFRFTFDNEQAINFLQANRINLVNIGNNHILNFHNNGLRQTEEFLDQGGMYYFGNPLDLNKAFLIENINGRKIAFVNYNSFAGPKFDEITNIIQKLKLTVDYLIVYTHWGREYELVENERQEKIAHQFIDAGADLMIGSHPHVVQPIEIYKNKVIFYSLGNFVFDQYFSEDVKSILGVGVLLGKNKVEFNLIPLYMQNSGQLQLMPKQQKQKFLQNLVEQSKINNTQKEEILISEIISI